MALNTNLKIAFIQAGKKQIDVALQIGMDNTRLSQIIQGRRPATDEEKRALARVLRRKVHELFPEAVAS